MQFTYSKKEAKPLARALEKFFTEKGIELEHGQAMDALARMQGYADWNALSEALSPEAIDDTLNGFEFVHLRNAAKLRYGEECELRAHTGFALRYDALSEVCEYVRTVDPLGRELAYWTCNEWQEDPALVMGAILGSLVRGRPRLVKKAKAGKASGDLDSHDKPLTIYVRASAQSEYGEGPDWAKLVLDAPLIARLKRLRAVVEALKVASITEWLDPDRWGPWEGQGFSDDSSGLSEAQLEVSKDGFWFSAPVKHADYFIETALVSFDLLAQAIAGNPHSDTDRYARRAESIVFALEENTVIRGSRSELIEQLLEAEEPVKQFMKAKA